ncbi:MAG: Gfo/Idh/MocA family oxidoreductase [Bacteroidota bacterium]
MQKVLFLLLLMLVQTTPVAAQHTSNTKPLRIGVKGLVHTHVHWILGRDDLGDIEIVGISEPNSDLARRYTKQHNLSMDLVYPTLEEMIAETQPDVVTDFGTIIGHLETVQACAPKGIHVMVEKPLAVSLDHARQMEQLAKDHDIHLLTNYESTWYPTTYKSGAMVKEGALGDLRKIVVHDGHPGPKEIGVNEEFLEWLTDPIQNGGGAITDFGCYGANLMTWLMQNERPLSVMAVTQQIKPDIYPKVDDEATIIVTYPKAQGIIQASWNWTYNRKDMAIYGTDGYIRTVDGPTMYTRLGEESKENKVLLDPVEYPINDPFAYFKAIVDGNLDPAYELSSLPNNMIVMEILEAAKQSALSGQRIDLKR